MSATQTQEQVKTSGSTQQQSKPQPKFKHERWIAFDGKVIESDDTTAIIEANDSTASVIEMGLSDVKIKGPSVQLRAGAIAKFLTLPTAEPAPATSPLKCRGSGSMCTGSAEFCCDNGELLDSCRGEWACPVSD